MRPPRNSRRTRRAVSQASYSSLRGRHPAWQTARPTRSRSVSPGNRARSRSVRRPRDEREKRTGKDSTNRRLLRLAVAVELLQVADIQFLQPGFDLRAIADDDPDLPACDVLRHRARHVGWRHGADALAERRVVVRRQIECHDLSYRTHDVPAALPAAGECARLTVL